MAESNSKLHGVNLSGWLTIESWITPELFSDSGALTERDLAASLGPERYAELVRAHRATFITGEDFAQIASRGYNAVRLPVPWYVFGNEGPHKGTYIGCLDQVDQAMGWARDNGIKVLLVLSISPGAEQVPSSRASATNWGRREDMLAVVAGLARRYAGREEFLGVEPADDPVPQRRRFLHVSEGVPIHQLRNFYREAYEAVRNTAGPDPIVVLPVAGMPEAWDLFLARNHDTHVWLDCHLYQFHDDLSKTVTVTDARKLVDDSRRTLERARRSQLPVMVGKWSAALPYADSAMTPEGRLALERVYVSEQLSAYRDCPAWFFQTWKTSGRLPNWDARIALSSFERRLLD